MRLLNLRSVSQSTKRIGVYEQPIIDAVSDYFGSIGWLVFPHARFSVAWGSIISDIDILLAKNNRIGVVEVKSRRDKIGKAKSQLNKLLDYIDFAYVATDLMPRTWRMRPIGLLEVRGSNVRTVKAADPISRAPTLESIAALRKECLFASADINVTRVQKYEAAAYLARFAKDPGAKQWLKEAALCSGDCAGHSPIWRYLKYTWTS